MIHAGSIPKSPGLRTGNQSTYCKRTIMAMAVVILMVHFSVAMAQQRYGDSNLDGLWFHLTSAGNPFLPSSPSCLSKGQVATKRDDYTYTFGIGGHKLHTSVTTWKEAKSVCMEEGGHLAIINSQSEADVLAKLFARSAPHARSYWPGYSWIGTFQPDPAQGDWQTIQGDTLTRAGFNEWHETKSPGGPHCGAAYLTGNMSWFACTRDLGFFCEVPYI